MCGYLGELVFRSQTCSNLETNVARALKTISHRGPDFSRVIVHDDYFAVGAVRLAMVDKYSRSNQPMVGTKGILAFNGEIYNFKELKHILELQNIIFETNGDTEVLLRILETGNFSLLKKIEGMFSFSYFDKQDQSLILGRDSLGKKPLFFAEMESNVVWSSEIKALSSLCKNSRISPLSDLYEYLLIGHLTGERTGSTGIYSVLPGQLLKFSKNGKSKMDHFWQHFPKAMSNISVRKELEKSIISRTYEQNAVAITLSGGLDSTSIAILLRNLDINFDAYSAAWSTSDKQKYNLDATYAAETARVLGVKFKQIEMPTAREIPLYLEKVISAIDEPFNNPTAISQYALFEKIAADGHRMVITGDGSDEIFAGYPRYRNDFNQNPFLSYLAELKAIDASCEKLALRNKKFVKLARTLMSAKNPIRTSSWHWVFNPKEISELHRDFNNSQYPKFDIFDDKRTSNKNLKTSYRRMIYDMSYDRSVWLPDHSNKMLDRMSMAHSIEARSPFQSEELINLCLSLDVSTLMGERTKPILRSVIPEIEKIVKAREDKGGFQSPIGYWLRENREFFSQLIFDESKKMNFNKKPISELVKEGFTGTHLQRVQLWTLASFFIWQKNRL